MPTQEARRSKKDNAVRARRRARSRDSATHVLLPKTQIDYLPHPRAARRASTDLGEVGGASTDGCQRLTPSCYEGAVAEREGFEPYERRWQ